jgi:hypothetical protein
MNRHDYVIVDAEGFVVMRIQSAMTNKSFEDYAAIFISPLLPIIAEQQGYGAVYYYPNSED